MDFALEELTRVAQLPSVRAVFIRPMFVEDRYLNHPYYDPLWGELEQLGITAAVHASDSSEARNRMAYATSSTSPGRRNGESGPSLIGEIPTA
jgi:hypothetical protein